MHCILSLPYHTYPTVENLQYAWNLLVEQTKNTTYPKREDASRKKPAANFRLALLPCMQPYRQRQSPATASQNLNYVSISFAQ